MSKKYLIVEDYYENAFLSNIRNTKRHLIDSGKDRCKDTTGAVCWYPLHGGIR